MMQIPHTCPHREQKTHYVCIDHFCTERCQQRRRPIHGDRVDICVAFFNEVPTHVHIAFVAGGGQGCCSGVGPSKHLHAASLDGGEQGRFSLNVGMIDAYIALFNQPPNRFILAHKCCGRKRCHPILVGLIDARLGLSIVPRNNLDMAIMCGIVKGRHSIRVGLVDVRLVLFD
jgi:hypothetical protein